MVCFFTLYCDTTEAGNTLNHSFTPLVLYFGPFNFSDILPPNTVHIPRNQYDQLPSFSDLLTSSSILFFPSYYFRLISSFIVVYLYLFVCFSFCAAQPQVNLRPTYRLAESIPRHSQSTGKQYQRVTFTACC